MTWTGNARTQTRMGRQSFWVRPALLDDTVIDEVFTRNSYRLPGRLDGATVIDGGAHIGVFTCMCVQRGATRVLAVEPEPENLLLLRVNVGPYPEQVQVWPNAIGGRQGTNRIVGESGGAHTDPTDLTGNPVEQVTLEMLIEQAVAVSILKLDMEGAEADAVLDCGHEWLSMVDRIVMETHGPNVCPWVERPRVGELVEHLGRTHNVEVEGSPGGLGKLFATRNGTVG